MVEKSILFTYDWRPCWMYQMVQIDLIWYNDNIHMDVWYMCRVWISTVFLFVMIAFKELLSLKDPFWSLCNSIKEVSSMLTHHGNKITEDNGKLQFHLRKLVGFHILLSEYIFLGCNWWEVIIRLDNGLEKATSYYLNQWWPSWATHICGTNQLMLRPIYELKNPELFGLVGSR